MIMAATIAVKLVFDLVVLMIDFLSLKFSFYKGHSIKMVDKAQWILIFTKLSK